MLGIGKGWGDGFFTCAEQVLVRTGSGVQDVDERRFALFLSDNDVAVFRCRACRHHVTRTRR